MNKIIKLNFLLLSVIIGIFISNSEALCKSLNYKTNKPPIPAPIDINTIQKTKTFNIEYIGYKNIKPYLNYYNLPYSNFCTYTVIPKIKDIEKDVEEYLKNKNNSQNDKEKIYIMYMKNLFFYASYIDNFNIYNEPSINKESQDWQFSKFTYNRVDYVVNNYKISFAYPYNCKSIKLANGGEGFLQPIIDAEFQYKLSLYLDTTWQNYWQIRDMEQTILNNNANIYEDGSLNIKINTLAEWITNWSNFQKLNTKPELSEDINERINTYINAFLMPNVYDFDNWGKYIGDDLTVQYPIRQLTDNGQAEFERLLNNLSKDTDAYKTINKAYNILKNNNYTTSDKYYKTFSQNNI